MVRLVCFYAFFQIKVYVIEFDMQTVKETIYKLNEKTNDLFDIIEI